MTGLRIDRITPPPQPLTASAAGPLVPRCHRARSALARLVGLLLTPDLGPHEAVWLEPCRSVHTIGLRAPIGAAFLDATGRVLRVDDPLPPMRVRGCQGTRAVVECRAGVLARVVPGDRLRLVPEPDATPAGHLCAPRGVIRAPLAPRVLDRRVAAGGGLAKEEG